MENTFDALKSISENSDIISEYENNQIFNYCYNMALAEKEEAGFKQGITKGINQGITQEKQEIAKKMISKNVDTKTISEFTELTEEEIEKIRAE